MFQKGKVSIIVPIYKVEKYIYRCIDSLLKQTYTNLEIILVNDGSPDNCGDIAEAYKRLDSRISALHKKNGGLSDARNLGMAYVTGEYTLFVDSDDWLHKDMIENAVFNSLSRNADVVQSAFFYAYDDKLLMDDRYYQENDPPAVLTNKALMYELVRNETVKNFAWGKLYKTKLVQDIPFKKNVLFEDVFWSHHVMQRVETYVITHKPLVFYYQRGDSIVASYTPRNLDMIEGLKERHRFIEFYYEELANESYKHILKTCLIHYNLLVLNKEQDEDGTHRKNIRLYIRDNCNQFINAIKDEPELRKQLFLFSLHPIFNMAFLGMKKTLRKVGFLKQPAGLKQLEIQGAMLNETC